MSSLLNDLMQNFVNKKSLFDVTDGIQVLNPVHSLVQLNLNKKESLKPKPFVDVGTHVKLLLEGIADDEKVKGFRSSCLKSCVTATTYLQQNLSLNNKIIEYAQYLHPEKKSFHGKKCYRRSYTQIGQGVWKEITVPMVNAPNRRNPPIHILAENESSKRENHHQNSYWKYALAYCGLFVDEDRPKSKYVRVDTYWHAVGQMTNEEGVLKYPQLFAFAKAILLLSHGNVVPERGFSINK